MFTLWQKKLILGLFICWPFFVLFLPQTLLFEMNLEIRNALPSFHHILGTDLFGRDLFLRLSYGLGVSYLLAIGVVAFSSLVGFFLAFTYVELKNKMIKNLIDQWMNYCFIMPTLIVALLLSAILEHHIWSIFLSISFYAICYLYFALRSQFIFLAQQPYMNYAKQAGFSKFHLMLHYYMRPIAPIIIERIKLIFLMAVSIETGLAFIGIHISPAIPSLGQILAQQYQYFYIFPVPFILSIAFFVGYLIAASKLIFLLSQFSKNID